MEAAAKALLRATGLREKSTATEHATSSSRPDPAAFTDELVFFVQSKEKRFIIGDTDLDKIVALLLWMAQDFLAISGISDDDIEEAALAAVAAVLKRGDAATKASRISLHTASVAKLAELIDIIMLRKDRSPKDPNNTLAFMRRVAKIRREVRATSSDNATERFELGQDEVSLCYRRFGRILLTDDLLPHQRQDKKYRLRNNFQGDTYLSTFQRSFIDSLLRKNLGDKKVAFLIWQHGLPSIADCPLVFRRRADHKEHYMGLLQSSLNDCLQWYSVLANEIVVHQNQEGFDATRAASSLEKQDRQCQKTRREALKKARDALRTGAALAKKRDDGKRSYDDMNVSQQTILEDFDTGKGKKAKQRFRTPRMKPFRCKMQIND